MKTEGHRTIIEKVDVDVDAAAFLKKIYSESIPIGFSFIGSDGYWYKQDGFDYHKREDLYEKVREATPDELEFQKSYNILLKFVKDNDL